MTARPLIPSLVMSLSLLAVPAVAQEASSGSGLALGVRGAYGIPVGDAVEDTSQSDLFGNTVAPQVDLSYFFNRHLSLGGYFQYGIAKPDGCDDTTECKARVLRFGVDLDYHFAPEGFVGPWVGVGVGYEIGSLRVGTSDDTLAKVGVRGFDLGHAHFGVDFQFTRSIAVGPYISASVGQYSNVDTEVFGGSNDVEVPSDQKSLHVWIQPGVRLQIRL
ncbi:MAG: hypothetical protein EOO71_08825 [Myxococcaceae bacterium]|nr:MAG: hypothetical protein EOO71_08825 [Myxococcaceae bacterium]